MTNTENLQILDSDYLEEETNEKVVLIDLRIRAIAFLLDYSLLTTLIYYTYQVIGHFIENIPEETTYILIGFYSFLFILMEYKLDGSIFKKLLKVKSVSVDNKKLGLHIYAAKLILRPITFLIALLYMKLCMAIILWIFGIQKQLLKFMRGEIFVLWYDYMIDQMNVKTR